MPSHSKPPKKKTGGPASTKKPSPFLILGILVTFFALWKWTGSRPPPKLAAQQPPATEPKVLSQKDFKDSKKKDEKRSLLLAQERAADLRPLPVSITADGIQLKVSSRLFVRRCIIGDYDIMERDLQISKRAEPGFVLSLENLDPGSRDKPIQVPLSLAQLKANISHSFLLPHSSKRNLWGLFICSSQGNSNCAAQSKLSLADLSRTQPSALHNPAEAARYPMDDKIFFFHFLIAYQDRLLLLDPLQTLDSSFQRLEKVLAQAGGDPISPSLMNQVKQDLRAIGSMPPVIKPGGIEIQMPHRGNCP